MRLANAQEEGGGDKGIRTPDLGNASAALYQLSYIPMQRKYSNNPFGGSTRTP